MAHAREEAFWDDLDPFEAAIEPADPVAAAPSSGSARAQRHFGSLRAHVRFAMRAFQGMVSRVEESEENAALPEDSHNSNCISHGNGLGGSNGHDRTFAMESVGTEGWLGSRTLDGEHVPHSVSVCNAGGDIDDMLNRRETSGESVLCPANALETEWNIPDLNLIFRPPKILMEAMAMGISPGKWVKLAPNATAGVQRSKWKTLKTVMSSGLAFKAEGQAAVFESDEEREARKKQLQLEVEQLKNFLLSITKAWEDLRVEMDDGYGGLRSRASSPPPIVHDAANGGSRKPCASIPIEEAADAGAADLKRDRLPQRSAIAVKGIATGICQLCQGLPAQTALKAGGLLDISALASSIRCPFPSAHAEVQITDVCGSKAPSKANQGVDGGAGGNGARASGSNRLNNVCAFKMKVLNGGDNVTLRIWANGKTQIFACRCAAKASLTDWFTQTSGCKDRSMLLAVNRCICDAIISSWRYNSANGLASVIRGDSDLQERAAAQLSDVRVLSAHILGSWNLDLRSVGARLDMPNLCDFLAQDRFSDRVFKVSHVKPRGNSARFNNLSLYIRRECLKTWREDGSDQTTVYVNVYEAGKCSVLAAPDADVAEELADVVCDMLLEALQQDHIRIHVDETAVPASKKQRA